MSDKKQVYINQNNHNVHVDLGRGLGSKCIIPFAHPSPAKDDLKEIELTEAQAEPFTSCKMLVSKAKYEKDRENAVKKAEQRKKDDAKAKSEHDAAIKKRQEEAAKEAEEKAAEEAKTDENTADVTAEVSDADGDVAPAADDQPAASDEDGDSTDADDTPADADTTDEDGDAAADEDEGDDLEALDKVGEKIAENLTNLGFTTYEKIANATHEELMAVDGITKLNVKKIHDSAVLAVAESDEG